MHKEATIKRKGTQRDEKLAEGCKYVAKGSEAEPKGSRTERNGSQKESKGSQKGAKREPKVKPQFVQKSICGKVGKIMPQGRP